MVRELTSRRTRSDVRFRAHSGRDRVVDGTGILTLSDGALAGTYPSLRRTGLADDLTGLGDISGD